jgi:hypothetical protein
MSDFKTQKALKLKPETLAAQVLDGEKLKNLLDLVEFLNTNGLKLRLAAKNAWEVVVRNPENTLTQNQILRRLRVDPENKTWSVSLHYFPEYTEHITDAELINFVWDNLHSKICHQNCKNIKTRSFFGKEFDSMCCNEQIRILNPSGKGLEYAKTLIMTAKTIVVSVRIGELYGII